jgi:DNA-binding transcriptional regulator/RsmH inhibitor MraZ
VLDRAGRLQLPQEFLSALEIERRVRLALEPDHIGVWPDQPNGARPAEDAGETAGETAAEGAAGAAAEGEGDAER